MNWILLAFIAPLLWAISNFIDKFLISKYFKGGSGTLVMFSCFIALPVAILILIFKPSVLDVNISTSLLMMLIGFISISYLFPYLKALNQADTSTVIPIFQIIPVFNYFLAFLILGEVLSKSQILASLMIIIGAVGISLKFDGRKTKLRGNIVLLMLLASLIVSLNAVLFKFFAIDLDYWTVSFWEYLGSLIFGIILFIGVKSYRTDFISSLKRNGKNILGLNTINEIVNVIAVMIFSYALLLAPVALVSVINGFQPLFVFLIGLFLTVFVPHLIKEDLGKKIILQKIAFILLMFIGAYLLGF